MEREANPKRYRDMCVPHEDRTKAIAALEGFYEDVKQARIKHRIADVHLIANAKAVLEDGQEADLPISLHLGDPNLGEQMAAFAYGYEKRMREEHIANALTGGKKK